MASDTLNLNLKINAETGQLEVVGQKFDAVSGKAKGLSSEAGALFKSFLPFATAGGILAFFTGAVKAAEEENEALRNLKFALESSGQSWESNKSQVMAWSNALQQTTRFSDGEALQALNRLTRATGDVAKAQSAATVAMNLAVATGKPLQETTDLVNGLITKQSRALQAAHKEYGTYVQGARTAQEALDALARSTRDAALNEDSLTKSTNITKAAFEDLQKQVGKTFLPAIDLLMKGIGGLVKVIDNLGSIAAGAFAQLFHQVEGAAGAVNAILHGRFGEARSIMKQTLENLKSDVRETAADVVGTWSQSEAQKTSIVQQGASERVTVTARETEEEKRLRMDQANKVADFQNEITRNLAALDQDQGRRKQQMLTLEMNQRRMKVNAEIRDEKQKQKLLTELDAEELKRNVFLARENLKVKQELAFATAETALQTLSILNSLGNKHNEAELNRARAILAFERAIAIARAISAAMAAPPGIATALAAAQVALVVAQSVQQFQALNAAQEAFKRGQQTISTNTIPMLDGSQVTEIGGGGGGFSSGFAAGGAGSFGGGGGGGGGISIVIGDIVIMGSADPEKIAQQVGEKILERIKGMGELSFTGVV